VAAGVLGVFAINVLRIALVVALGYFAGSPAALVFHDYGGTILTLVWLLAFWSLVLGGLGKRSAPYTAQGGDILEGDPSGTPDSSPGSTDDR
jgi:hypothetical protein